MIRAIAVPKEAQESKALTDEQFMALPEDDRLYEYIDGELIVVANSGVEHGYLALTLGYFLTGFVRNHQLGITCDSSTAFKMKTGNKRSRSTLYCIVRGNYVRLRF